jgi:hypothetical protein
MANSFLGSSGSNSNSRSSTIPYAPRDLRVAPLPSTDIVCLVGPGHPLAERRAIDLA